MLDPHGLYELADDLPALDSPVLIQALTGFVDAGSAIQLSREHLLEQLDGEVVATFDLDQLLDYRSRRPPMIFVEDHWESYEQPSLALHLLRDQLGKQFLLLSGPEPDLQWERFIAAVTGLIDRLGVSLTVGLNAIPMAVPHTRPVSVTAHATDQKLLGDHESWLQRVQVPASMGNLLEFRLGEAGHDAMGYAAHVPHYLAQTTYPAAAELLLDSVSSTTGLALPTGQLREAAGLVREEVDKQVADDEQASPAGRLAGAAVRRVPARPPGQPAGRCDRPAADRRGARRRAGALPGRPDQGQGQRQLTVTPRMASVLQL